MWTRRNRVWIGVLAAGLMAIVPCLGKENSPAASGAAQVIVTVQPRKGAGVYSPSNLDGLRVYENGSKRPIVSVTAPSGPIDFTVMLDDSIGARTTAQYGDLTDFFSSLPAGARVRIAYASFGGNEIAQDFTTNYELASRALRVPVGRVAAGGSIYDSVADLVKKWPEDGNRRELLLVSDGIDLQNGYVDTQAPLNMELQRAIDVAQKAHVAVYTIFSRGPRVLENSGLLLLNGQSCLLRLAKSTGGQAFFQGTLTPLAFAPYLKQISRDLRNQFELAFKPLEATTTAFQRLRVACDDPAVRLNAPTRVFIAKAG